MGCSTARSAGRAPLQNLVHVNRGPPYLAQSIRSIGHETPTFGKLSDVVRHGEAVRHRELDHTRTILREEGIQIHVKRADPLLGEGGDHTLKQHG